MAPLSHKKKDRRISKSGFALKDQYVTLNFDLSYNEWTLKCVFQENCRKLIVAMTKYLKIVIEKIARSKFDLFQKFCHSDNNLLIYNDVSIQVIL